MTLQTPWNARTRVRAQKHVALVSMLGHSKWLMHRTWFDKLSAHMRISPSMRLRSLVVDLDWISPVWDSERFASRSPSVGGPLPVNRTHFPGMSSLQRMIYRMSPWFKDNNEILLVVAGACHAVYTLLPAFEITKLVSSIRASLDRSICFLSAGIDQLPR